MPTDVMYKWQRTRHVARRQEKALAAVACYSNAYLLLHIRIQSNVTARNR
jgi:hypothetical protein